MVGFEPTRTLFQRFSALTDTQPLSTTSITYPIQKYELFIIIPNPLKFDLINLNRLKEYKLNPEYTL